jgi:hypothetical protein
MKSNELPEMKKSWCPSVSDNVRDSIAFIFIFLISVAIMFHYRGDVGYNQSYVLGAGVAIFLTYIYGCSLKWAQNPTSAIRRARK